MQKVKPICPYFYDCGGCDTQDISYVDQCTGKQERLQELFSSLPTEWLPFLASPEKYPIFYRNKIRFAFIEHEGHIWPSRHRKGEEDADIPVRECFLQSEEANRIIRYLAKYIESHAWPIFNGKTGWFKHVLIRQGKRTGETLVSLVTTNEPVPAEFIHDFTSEFPITSLYQTVTEGRNNEKLEDHLLWGEPAILEKVGSFTFRISPHAFFQTNSEMVEALYSTVANQIQEGTVWDLYAGSATIGSYISSKANKVISIENNPQNIADAEWNIKHNNISNIIIAPGTVEEVVTSAFIQERGKPDVIIVDPPRAGLSEKTRNLLAGIRPEKIVYVSCNPQTCLRDSQDLVRRGFKLVSAQGIDMFPHTLHCEMITSFERN